MSLVFWSLISLLKFWTDGSSVSVCLFELMPSRCSIYISLLRTQSCVAFVLLLTSTSRSSITIFWFRLRQVSLQYIMFFGKTFFNYFHVYHMSLFNSNFTFSIPTVFAVWIAYSFLIVNIVMMKNCRCLPLWVLPLIPLVHRYSVRELSAFNVLFEWFILVFESEENFWFLSGSIDNRVLFPYFYDCGNFPWEFYLVLRGHWFWSDSFVFQMWDVSFVCDGYVHFRYESSIKVHLKLLIMTRL